MLSQLAPRQDVIDLFLLTIGIDYSVSDAKSHLQVLLDGHEVV